MIPISIFSRLKRKPKDGDKTANKKAKARKKKPKTRKIVKKYYEVVYQDSRGKEHTVKAKTFAEARRKAEELAEKGMHNITIRRAQTEIKVEVPTSTIFFESLLYGFGETNNKRKPARDYRNARTRKTSTKSRKPHKTDNCNTWDPFGGMNNPFRVKDPFDWSW